MNNPKVIIKTNVISLNYQLTLSNPNVPINNTNWIKLIKLHSSNNYTTDIEIINEYSNDN